MIAKANRSIDVELVLRPIPDKHGGRAYRDTGLLDSSLFKGTNTLHAKMDTQTCLWYLEYEMGILPRALKQKFTGYSPLIKFVTEYMKGRNVQIVEIKD